MAESNCFDCRYMYYRDGFEHCRMRDTRKTGYFEVGPTLRDYLLVSSMRQGGCLAYKRYSLADAVREAVNF